MSRRLLRYKTLPCHFVLQKQECPKGDKCTYAHVQAELRPMRVQPNFKSVKCREFEEGSCEFGMACAFLHDEVRKETDGHEITFTGYYFDTVSYRRIMYQDQYGDWECAFEEGPFSMSPALKYQLGKGKGKAAVQILKREQAQEQKESMPETTHDPFWDTDLGKSTEQNNVAFLGPHVEGLPCPSLFVFDKNQDMFIHCVSNVKVALWDPSTNQPLANVETTFVCEI